MKLAASKVDFRSGCEVGVRVVLVAPADVTTEGEGVGDEGRVVGLAVELVGTGVAVGTAEQESVLFAMLQLLMGTLEQYVLLASLHSTQKQVVLLMVTSTQETQLLRFSQVSGCAVGVSVVSTGLLVTVEGSVTLGVTLLFCCCAAATQSAARQVAAQSSLRETPDIASSAQASRRKLRRARLRSTPS